MTAQHRDTPLETAVRIAEIDTRVALLVETTAEIKSAQRHLFQRLDAIGNAQTQISGLLELVNVNAARSDERWKQMLSDRKADLVDWTKWRGEVDDFQSSQKTTQRLLAASFTALVTVVLWAGNYFLSQIATERLSNTALIVQNKADMDSRVGVNTNRIRALELHAQNTDPNFRPPAQ